MSEDKITEPKPKKKTWKKMLAIGGFILINVVVIVITAVSEFGNSKEAAELADIKINWWLLIPATVCFLLATLANVYKYVVVMKNVYRKTEAPVTETKTKKTQDKNSLSESPNANLPVADSPARKHVWKNAWRVVMLGKYYDNITPAAVGGQPFQIYYMYKYTELPHGEAASVPIVGMISTQIAFLIVGILCFVFGNILGENPTLAVMAWVGLIFYAFWPVMIFGTSFFPKATARFLNFFVKILAKIRLIKNHEKVLKKVENEVSEYARAIKELAKTGRVLVNVLILSILFEILTISIPFFVLMSFGGTVDFAKCFVTTAAVMSAVYFVPTPGNSGAAEGTFFIVFSALSQGYIFWAMLVWRFFSYYVYVLVGFLIYLRLYFEKRLLLRRGRGIIS